VRVYVKQYPPAQLLTDCQEPRFEAVAPTLGDLAHYAAALRHSLRRCTLDKRTLREWRKN